MSKKIQECRPTENASHPEQSMQGVHKESAMLCRSTSTTLDPMVKEYVVREFSDKLLDNNVASISIMGYGVLKLDNPAISF
jgi:hypothetical protein